jgi:hypothetical protein
MLGLPLRLERDTIAGGTYRLGRVLPAALHLVAVCLVAAPLRAQAPVNDPRTTARTIAEKAYALYDAGRYEEAIASLRQAEAYYHAPTLVFAMAKAHAALGHLVVARDLFQRVAAERLPETAPAGFREAQRMAQAELTAIDKRIPTLQIVALGAGSRSARVTVDGAPVAPDALAAPLPEDPGVHRVVVAADGGPSETRTVELADGERRRLEIDLGGPEAPSASPARPWLAPALVGFGVGAVGLAFGIPEGVVAVSRSSELGMRCTNGICPATEADTLASGRRAATVSTVGFVLAGAGLAAGVVLVAVRPGAGATATAALTLGPAAAFVKGAF